MSKKLREILEKTANDQLNAFGLDAVRRLQSAPVDHACAKHQKSFQTIIAVMRFVIAKILSDRVKGFRSIPFGAVDDLLVWVCEGPLDYGVSLYAALTRKPEDRPAEDPVGFTEIWNAMQEALDFPDSEHGKAFQVALNQVGPLQYVLAHTTCAALEKQLELHPAFASYEDDVGELMFENMLRGVATEFCFPRLIAEKSE